MKTTIKTSALSGPASTTNTRFPSPAFGLGFQQFLSHPPAYADEVIKAPAMRQPLRYLEAVPPQDDTGIGEQPLTMNVAEALSDCLGAAILLSARPTTKSLSLAHAVNALRTMNS
ncbi:MAG: hypothetical protein JNM99_02255 [Verrucomicrobiaceae bacterium]|nr:hypothetical protein [Verrucomicrobiaceae bacterium]